MKSLENILHESIFDDDFGMGADVTFTMTLQNIVSICGENGQESEVPGMISVEDFNALWEWLDDKKVTRDLGFTKMHLNDFISRRTNEYDLQSLAMTGGDTPKFPIICKFSKIRNREIRIFTNDVNYPRICKRDMSADHMSITLRCNNINVWTSMGIFDFDLAEVNTNYMKDLKIFKVPTKYMISIMNNLKS